MYRRFRKYSNKEPSACSVAELIFVMAWMSACTIVMSLMFMQAYLNGMSVMVAINDYGEANIELALLIVGNILALNVARKVFIKMKYG